MADGPENDYFATQFATAIVKESGDPPPWWFREKYEKGEILVDKFDISNVNYEIDPNDSTFATVTMDVDIAARIDGESHSGAFKLTHKVKLGWQTYESTLS